MSNVTGYSISHYGTMITGPVRMNAYAAALKAAISPDSIVLDIGAGSGIMSLLACKYGARHVYAIEPNDSINVARKLAKANGYEDRLTFYQDLSTKVSLPEQADVIVSDLRGVLPVFEHHVSSIADARARHLAPGGVLIPQQDTVWAAVIETPEIYQELLKPWSENVFGLDFSPHRTAAVDAIHNELVKKEYLLTCPQCLTTWDYRTVSDPNISTKIRFIAQRAGTAHGISVWFETVLFENIGFSTAPGNERLAYGMAMMLFTRPVGVAEGDVIELEFKCNLIGDVYVWQWNSRFFEKDSLDKPKAEFRQSTFNNHLPVWKNLQKRASNFTPIANDEGERVKQVLLMMNGKTSLEEIARWLATRFPGAHPTWQEALGWVGKISEKFSR
jgi:protein arginine N-methyltransferase 1